MQEPDVGLDPGTPESRRAFVLNKKDRKTTFPNQHSSSSPRDNPYPEAAVCPSCAEVTCISINNRRSYFVCPESSQKWYHTQGPLLIPALFTQHNFSVWTMMVLVNLVPWCLCPAVVHDAVNIFVCPLLKDTQSLILQRSGGRLWGAWPSMRTLYCTPSGIWHLHTSFSYTVWRANILSLFSYGFFFSGYCWCYWDFLLPLWVFLKIYLFVWHRERTWAGGAEGEGEGISSRRRAEHRARRGASSHDLDIKTWAETKHDTQLTGPTRSPPFCEFLTRNPFSLQGSGDGRGIVCCLHNIDWNCLYILDANKLSLTPQCAFKKNL